MVQYSYRMPRGGDETRIAAGDTSGYGRYHGTRSRQWAVRKPAPIDRVTIHHTRL
jgi:hypothetical protein